MRDTAYNCDVLVKYGERFRDLRERAALSQEQVAAKLKVKKDRGSSISNIEIRMTRPPARQATIVKHAAALNCEPWELLAGVPTAHDRLRAPKPLSDEEMSALLWGLAYVKPSDRRTVFLNLQTFLDAIPRGEVPTPAQIHGPALAGKATRTHQGKRRA